MRGSASKTVLPGQPLKATTLDGHVVKTDKVGWYLRTNHSVGIDTDGNYYSLTVPGGWMERLRGVPIPPDALTPSEGFNPNIGILIDVEREDDTDPTPQRFTAMLEAALAIAELNERLNPAS